MGAQRRTIFWSGGMREKKEGRQGLRKEVIPKWGLVGINTLKKERWERKGGQVLGISKCSSPNMRGKCLRHYHLVLRALPVRQVIFCAT